ncbi:hypothetical protein BaRGS_00028846, partial [Batillaria attramentaria]
KKKLDNARERLEKAAAFRQFEGVSTQCDLFESSLRESAVQIFPLSALSSANTTSARPKSPHRHTNGDLMASAGGREKEEESVT